VDYVIKRYTTNLKPFAKETASRESQKLLHALRGREHSLLNLCIIHTAVIVNLRGDLLKIRFLSVFAATAFFVFLGCSAAELATMGMRPQYARSPVFDSKPVWRAVVLPPVSASPSFMTDSRGLQDFAGMSLLQTGRFTLVDRTAVDRILDEQEFSYSGAADQATAVQLGRLLGAEAVMTISVTSVAHDSFWDDEPSQRDAVLHIKIISVETSEVLYTSIGEGSDFDGAEGALRSALQVALMGLNN